MEKGMQEEEESMKIGKRKCEIDNPIDKMRFHRGGKDCTCAMCKEIEDFILKVEEEAADQLRSLLGNTVFHDIIEGSPSEKQPLKPKSQRQKPAHSSAQPSKHSHVSKRSMSENSSVDKLHLKKKGRSDPFLSKTLKRHHQCRYCLCFFKKTCALTSHLRYCKWARIGHVVPKNQADSPRKIATSLPVQDQTFKGRGSSATLSDTSSELKSDLQLKPTQCNFCRSTFKTLQALISHRKACKRTKGKPIKCNHCHRVFKKMSGLSSHFKTCKWPEIYVSKNKKNTDTSLKMETSLPVPNQALIDTESKESLSETPSELSRIQNNFFQCDHCTTTFTKVEKLKCHLKSCKMAETGLTNSKKKTDSEVNVETKYPTYSRLLNQKPFQCTYCGVAFKTGKILLCHSKSCLKTKPMLKEVNFTGEFDEGKTAAEEKTKVDKMISIMSLKENTGMVVDGPLRCPFCRKTYETLNSLNMHIDKHMKENPEEVRPFSCTFCKATFLKVRNLRGHIMTHKAEKPFKCNYCSSSFRNMSYLKVHHRSHTGEKPFKCSLCDAAFTRNDSLTIHIRNHSDYRPYQCSKCPQSFVRKDDLNGHMQMHM